MHIRELQKFVEIWNTFIFHHLKQLHGVDPKTSKKKKIIGRTITLWYGVLTNPLLRLRFLWFSKENVSIRKIVSIKLTLCTVSIIAVFFFLL